MTFISRSHRNKNLRHRAEALLQKKLIQPLLISSDVKSLQHELHVHRIELELQNEELRAAEQRLRGLLDRYTDLYDFAPVGYFTLDAQGVIVKANQCGAALLGINRDKLPGQVFTNFIAAVDRDRYIAYRVRLLQAKTGVPPLEVLLRPATGALRCVLLNGTRAPTVADQAEEYRFALSDITDLRHAESTLKDTTAHLSAVPDMMMTVDRELRIRTLNHAPEGLDSGQFIATPILDHVDPTSRATVADSLRQVLDSGQPNRHEALAIGPFNSLHWYDVHVGPILDNEGGVVGAILVIRDITARKVLEEALRERERQVRFLAEHDPLTGLPNRALFEDRLAQACSQAHRQQQRLAVLFIDLDRFKPINDTLGHAIGDRLLQETAQRLAACLRQSDTVARIGGDEFVILLLNIEDISAVRQVIDKLLETITQPFHIDAHCLHISLSVGVALYPEHSQDVATLLRQADTALYKAKSDGRGICRFYEPAMGETALARMHLEIELRTALQRDEFILLYQPQIAVSHGQPIGFEVLLRWQHPQRGLLTPELFMDVAEQSGLMVPIGDWVLDSACRQLRAWQNSGEGARRALSVAVNLSRTQLAQDNLPTRITAILAAHQVHPAQLELELPEEALMTHPTTLALLAKLKRIGVRLVLNEFGVGYSSLEYLQQMPLDKIKIASSLVRQLTQSQRHDALVAAIIGLGKYLDLCVLGSGVETREQWQFLQAYGCDQLQGAAIGAPLMAAAVEGWLRDWHYSPLELST